MPDDGLTALDRAGLLAFLAARVLAVHLPHPTRVGIDGVDAAGKTCLAGELADFLEARTTRQVIRASIDRFHHPRAYRYRQGADSPRGYYEDSFDLPALRHKLLDPLGPGGSRVIQTEHFDVRRDAALEAAAQTASPDALLVLDGIFLQRPELAGGWDFILFLQVDFDTSLARAIERDQAVLGEPEEVVKRYRARYIPAQQAYLAACRPAERADVCVDNTYPQRPVVVSGWG